MTSDEQFRRNLAAWLDDDARNRVPTHLTEVLVHTTASRQRPWWSSPERWLPMQLTYEARVVRSNRLFVTLAVLTMVVLVAAALLLAAAGPRKVPHFGSAGNGLIAFVDGTTLKLADADGSNIRVGATLPGAVESLTFSPDGTRLAYRTAGTSASIVVAAADGSRPVVVSGSATVATPAQIATRGPFAWSPDSRRVAFTVALADGTRTIDVVDADGSHLAPLAANATAPNADRFDPVWSPDGLWISFFSTVTPGSILLNLIHPDGTGARVLPTTPPNPSYAEVSWSPDPSVQRLEYAAGEDVKIFDIPTATETRVATGFWGSWSPDGRSIAWWDAKPGDLGSPTAGGILVARVDDVLSGSATPVAVFPGLNNYACYSGGLRVGICSPAAWSPDSRWIFGPDPTGTSIVFSTVSEPRAVRTIKLDQKADLSNGPLGHLAWQPVAP